MADGAHTHGAVLKAGGILSAFVVAVILANSGGHGTSRTVSADPTPTPSPSVSIRERVVTHRVVEHVGMSFGTVSLIVGVLVVVIIGLVVWALWLRSRRETVELVEEVNSDGIRQPSGVRVRGKR